jgi:hypothetical protein
VGIDSYGAVGFPVRLRNQPLLEINVDNPNRLAEFFNKQREIIEAAETPFSKWAIFILPILAPIVPASLTGLHLYKLFLQIFTFSGADRVAIILSVIVSLVLEMLGYVGAISFIQSVFRWVKTRNSLYFLPSFLNGLSYSFYLILMFMVNYLLGRYFQTPDIINNIVGLLSFMTVPTGLLAANYLSQKELKDEDKELRRENREERLEKLRIKQGKLTETYQKDVEKVSESSENLPKDWRNLRKILTEQDVANLAHLSAENIREVSVKYRVDERTVINWRMYAQKELGMRQ